MSITPRLVRNLVRKIHLWLGLTIGLWLVVMGLTGSLLAFYPRIDAWLNPVGAVGQPAASMDEIYGLLRATYPERSAHWRIEIAPAGQPFQARSLSAEDMAGTRFAPLMVWIDPHDPAILRSEQWGRYAMTWVYDLHYHLQLGPRGAVVVGGFGLLTLILLLTGLVNWWPQPGSSFRKALSLRRGAAPVRTLYDVHRLVGIGGMALLLPMVLTGVMMSLPAPTQGALSLFMPVSVPVSPAPVLEQADDGRQVSIETALGTARSIFPAAPLRWIETPASGAANYAFKFETAGDPNRRFPHSTVWVDRHSGRIAGTLDAGKRVGTASVASWFYPLHSGEVLGLPTRIVVCLAGLLPLVLFGSGLWRWLLIQRRHRTPAAG
ncbi:PepSY domain-containing protein [Altererythrobacter xixiisoli]|uniref:PepSY domain-containing protein n=1 Tax=Croceibacterium xixiisoli TaxID=1476466 RepID=A0A6I4TVS3_9SPHN|nr:PepSY-associated TM helix domain-containing protein [Croceibacterium xixiisoli]MXP00306.1 PepSY domain-containing protein [Croceibacterium xixiisoli]